MSDTCYDGKMPPKDVAHIQEHIAVTCKEFRDWSDVKFGKWGLAVVAKTWQTDARLGLLAAIGIDIVNHMRAGGSVILTEPPATEMER